ncbi:hypothetical protein D3C86_647560 [compost metagenome]
MVESVDDDDRSDPVAVEAFPGLPHQDAELFAPLMQRVIAKTQPDQTAVAQLRADIGQKVIGLSAPDALGSARHIRQVADEPGICFGGQRHL